jgi:hypothetical protein
MTVGNGSTDPPPTEENLPIPVPIPRVGERFLLRLEPDGDPIPDITKKIPYT